MTEIIPRIFVGSFDDSFEDTVLDKVTHILNVASEINIESRANHIYLKCGINDDDHNDDIRNILESCAEFINKAYQEGGSILIHCWFGKCRSVCACIYFLCTRLKDKKYKFEDALNLLKQKRPQIDIFPLYEHQLRLALTKKI